MGLFDVQYLSDAQLKGFDSYKYSCVDNSPLSVYISHPFWNWLVTWYPRTWTPNVLTLVGWSFVLGCFLLESVLDYDLTSNSVGSKHPVPDWFWLTASLCTFIGHTLDGTDGKQARRIGATGPTGELFDHGLDSWSTVPFTITIFSVFGRGEFSVSPVRLLLVLISVQIVFIATHWEKYNTGVLFLSWGYDASQYLLIFIYLFTYVVGYKWFQFYVVDGITFAVFFESCCYLCCFGSVAMSIYNMWHSYAIEKTFKQPSLYEAIRPLIPCMILFIVSLFNIACRLIISQMSNQRCEVTNRLLTLYIVVVGISMFVPAIELKLLQLSTLIIVVLHVHYGICVVRQLCAHFKIHAFDVSYLKK
ncbi:hypothetical protein KIN20_026526 [Parelaphostrongylus tenuis]|uniref:Ethanolaminephosphotransferase n=1 Tax=Parelaphostrongylus tenuis TaxID=148309 RepID=A0AAD5QY60_PARTN|nr:hypothetical protein KIN20_026526 [Parelaphostrongylus tenuis]